MNGNDYCLRCTINSEKVVKLSKALAATAAEVRYNRVQINFLLLQLGFPELKE